MIPLLFLWDGGAATVDTLICETGVFQLSGQTATFGLTGNITTVCDTGVFVVSGQDAAFPQVRIPIPGTGGAGRGGRRRRWRVEKKGVEREFDSVHDALAFMREPEPVEKGKRGRPRVNPLIRAATKILYGDADVTTLRVGKYLLPEAIVKGMDATELQNYMNQLDDDEAAIAVILQ